MIAWAAYSVGTRTIFEILSSGTRNISCLRSGLWDFVEIKGISRAGNQIAFIHQFMELVMVCRACHADCLSDCNRG